MRPAGTSEVDGQVKDASVDRCGHKRNDTIRGLKRTLYRAARNVRHPRRLLEARTIRAEVADFLGGREMLASYEREVRASGLRERLLDKGREHLAAVGGSGHSLGAIGYTEGTYLYAVLRHVRPKVAVETGVANGFSTAFSLLALERNGEGHLHSVDLPREVGRDYDPGTFYEGEGRAGIPSGSEPGWLIPPELKERWTLILGRSQSSSVLGETVLDPFAGAGSTLVAATIEGRKSIGIELEERYCAVAAERLQRAESIYGRLIES